MASPSKLASAAITPAWVTVTSTINATDIHVFDGDGEVHSRRGAGAGWSESDRMQRELLCADVELSSSTRWGVY